MNPVHNVCINSTLFLTYLLRPVPSDVQLFIQAVHITTFFDHRVDLVGQLSRNGYEGMLQIDAPLLKISGYATALQYVIN